MGRYRWICYQNDNDALSLGRSPEALPFFHYESETNCCRGGHCDRLLGEMMGDTHLLGFLAYGEGATPMRAGRWWMDLHGGRFLPSQLSDRWQCERFNLAPEAP